MRTAREGQHGIALLVVLLTITLLTVVVVEFTQSAQVETHFAISSRNALQAFYLARSGVNVGEALLTYDAQANHYDGNDDAWARPLPPLPVGDGTVALRIEDEGRRLNVNALAASAQTHRRDVFERLFQVLGVDRRVLAAIADWIDADSDPSADPPGAEQPFYVGLRPPVVVRNAPVLTLRELQQVRGMTPTLYARLAEFLYVISPTQTDFSELKVNVNTAPAEVLYALSPGLMADPGGVSRMIAARTEQPFINVSELKAVPGWSQAHVDEKLVTTSSAYFRIDAVGQVNDVARGITATVSRMPSGSRTRLTRVAWKPSTADLSLTSQPPSDFLATLPPLGGND